MGTLNMHDYQHNTTMSVQFSCSLSQRPIFIFFVADVMSNYLITDGLKIFSLLPEAALRPEARGICHICHMVNPALCKRLQACIAADGGHFKYAL